MWADARAPPWVASNRGGKASRKSSRRRSTLGAAMLLVDDWLDVTMGMG